MKILIGCEVFYPYLYGGGEVFAYEVSRQLAKMGHEVHIVCPRDSFDRPNSHLPLLSSVDGVKVHRVRGEFRYRHGIQSLPYMLRMYIETSRIIHETGIQIVNAQTFRPCLPLLAAAKKNSVPCIVTIFDIYSRGSMYGLENWLKFYSTFGIFGWATEQMILRLPFSRVITNSNATKNKIRKLLPSARIHVVKCAVDLQNYPRNYPKKTPGMVLYLGRLAYYKNVEDLVEVVARLRPKRNDATLTIAGTGPLESELRKMADSMNYVTFIRNPKGSDKIKLLRSAEVLVIPSSEEGFGIVLLESNAAYTPFVCYNIPALKELVQETQGGLLAKHRNVDDLSNKILQIIENKTFARRLAMSGRNAVEKRFSWTHTAERIERIFQDTLNSS
ncbi:MAG TPA: glycosyltransferase family 4 protein [Candidatus Bathyarchaeia archaeon]|nr:glycosyltransferase family 4 protein [Candidatus Bathyarchaeia archaeon]